MKKITVKSWSGKTWEMTPEQIEAAYRYQQRYYRVMDAQDHIETFLNECSEDKEKFKEKFGVDYDWIYDMANVIAEDFINHHDCDIAENDQFDGIIQNYIDRMKEKNNGEQMGYVTVI